MENLQKAVEAHNAALKVWQEASSTKVVNKLLGLSEKGQAYFRCNVLAGDVVTAARALIAQQQKEGKDEQ